MQLDIIRLVLLIREQLSLFDERQQIDTIPIREEWLRKVFSRSIAFSHRGADFHFVPHNSPDPRFIIGRVGRQVNVKENEPPEDGLQETWRDTWRAVTVLIDPRPHEDGQKAAVAVDARVGKPLALLRSLVSHLNTFDHSQPYVIEANAIVDPNTFWEFVRENKGQIVSVTFELFAPNMFGIHDDYDKEMRDLKDKERVRKAYFTIQNEDGLELETERVKKTAEYTARGGGSISAKAAGGRTFRSNKKIKHVTIHSVGEDEGTSSFLLSVIASVFNL